MAYLMEHKCVFDLKTLERKLPKAKGIVSQSVKEVLQSLIDDNLICNDKIGSGNYFWLFPSQAFTTRQNKLNTMNKRIKESKELLESLKNKKRKLENERKETDERD